jgi:hypothetical protein
LSWPTPVLHAGDYCHGFIASDIISDKIFDILIVDIIDTIDLSEFFAFRKEYYILRMFDINMGFILKIWHWNLGNDIHGSIRYYMRSIKNKVQAHIICVMCIESYMRHANKIYDVFKSYSNILFVTDPLNRDAIRISYMLSYGDINPNYLFEMLLEHKPLYEKYRDIYENALYEVIINKLLRGAMPPLTPEISNFEFIISGIYNKYNGKNSSAQFQTQNKINNKCVRYQ